MSDIAIVISVALPCAALAYKILANGKYVTMREFDDFRGEIRDHLKEIRSQLQELIKRSMDRR